MSITLTDGQVITGAAVTGLTTPTYTLALDTAPDIFSKQFAVTTIGGTQTDVTSHSPSSPFTVTVKRPKSLAILGNVNPNTGLLQSASVPKNSYSIIVRKGASPLANNPAQVAIARIDIAIPAGTESYQSNQMRALLSFLTGVLTNQLNGVSAMTVTGIM